MPRRTGRPGAANFECFKEDLLQIRQLRLEDGRHEIDHDGWLLDLGWYPDSDPNGAYILKVLRGDWRRPVEFTVRDSNIQTLRAALERILDGLSRREDLARLKEAVGGR